MSLTMRGVISPGRRVVFIRPSTPALRFDHDTDEVYSPRSIQQAVRSLELAPGQATPCHMHVIKEKIYILIAGDLTVFIERDGYLKPHPLNSMRDSVVIPAERWHAIWNHSEREAVIKIISSTKNSKDIAWEDNAVELINLGVHTTT